MNWRIKSLCVLLLASCQTREKLQTPYANPQELKSPIVFADSIYTRNGIYFSNDGNILYLSYSIEKTFDNERKYAGIFRSEFLNNSWSEPQQVNLGLDIDAYHPVLSIDDQFLFFNSRSHLDSGNSSIKHNIWVAALNDGRWSDPQMLDGVNSEAYDSYPTIAKNNNLYFNSDRAGGLGGMDIYLSRFVDGKYLTPQNIQTLNSADEENDLVIDPQERFIIFNRYFHSNQSLDLFISFRRNNEWTTPRLLDNINTSEGWELTPTLSPDGKYFFYELNGLIMQMDLAHLIFPEELEGFGKRGS